MSLPGFRRFPISSSIWGITIEKLTNDIIGFEQPGPGSTDCLSLNFLYLEWITCT